MRTAIAVVKNQKEAIMVRLHRFLPVFSKIPYSKKAWRFVWRIRVAEATDWIILLERSSSKRQKSLIGEDEIRPVSSI